MMNNISNKLVVVLPALLVLLACNDRTAQPEKAEVKLDSVTQVLEAERRLSDSLAGELEQVEMREEAYPILFGKQFRHIENPEEYIINNLRNKREAIPLEPVLGGVMQFRKIEVLSDKWVLAIYDDGHIQGTSIYEYRLKPNDSLEFSVLVSDHPK